MARPPRQQSGRSRFFRALRQAWTGDRSEGRPDSHLFVPSRDNIVTCAACGRTEAGGDHDGSALNNENSFI